MSQSPSGLLKILDDTTKIKYNNSMRNKSLATSVSRSVVEHFKLYHDSIIPDFRDYHRNLFVQVRVIERSDEESETGIFSANYNSLSQTIKVEVIAPLELTGSWFSKFIPSFKRSLRHELEHYTQHVRGGLHDDVLVPFLTIDGSFKGKPQKGPWTSVVEAARYFLNPLEIEAHVVGIRTEANARRVKFHVVFKEKLEEIASNLRGCGFDELKVRFMSRRLYQVWGFYALRRFPSLRRKIRKPVRVLVQKSFDFPIDE